MIRFLSNQLRHCGIRTPTPAGSKVCLRATQRGKYATLLVGGEPGDLERVGERHGSHVEARQVETLVE